MNQRIVISMKPEQMAKLRLIQARKGYDRVQKLVKVLVESFIENEMKVIEG